MLPGPPPRTFADLEPAGLEMVVTCQRCGHEAVIDDRLPRLLKQPIAGRRYRCTRCKAIGLPSLGTRRLGERLAKRETTIDWSARKRDPQR